MSAKKSREPAKDTFADGLADNQIRLVDEFCQCAELLDAQFASIVEQVIPPNYEIRRVELLHKASAIAASLEEAHIEIAFFQGKQIYKPEQPVFSDRDLVASSRRQYFYSVFRMATETTERPEPYGSLFLIDMVLARKNPDNTYCVRHVVP